MIHIDKNASVLKDWSAATFPPVDSAALLKINSSATDGFHEVLISSFLKQYCLSMKTN